MTKLARANLDSNIHHPNLFLNLPNICNFIQNDTTLFTFSTLNIYFVPVGEQMSNKFNFDVLRNMYVSTGELGKQQGRSWTRLYVRTRPRHILLHPIINIRANGYWLLISRRAKSAMDCKA